jgi:hypothetical protein
MRILGKASDAQREGTHRCVNVGPLGNPSAIWDGLGEAGGKSWACESVKETLGLTFRELLWRCRCS